MDSMTPYIAASFGAYNIMRMHTEQSLMHHLPVIVNVFITSTE